MLGTTCVFHRRKFVRSRRTVIVDELMGAKVAADADEERAPAELERDRAIADVGSPAAERGRTLTLDWIDVASALIPSLKVYFSVPWLLATVSLY